MRTKIREAVVEHANLLVREPFHSIWVNPEQSQLFLGKRCLVAPSSRIPKNGLRKLLDFTGSKRYPMIRLGPRRGRRALDHIQPVHGRVGIAAAGEVADVFHVAGESGVEEGRVERDDGVGLWQI